MYLNGLTEHGDIGALIGSRAATLGFPNGTTLASTVVGHDATLIEFDNFVTDQEVKLLAEIELYTLNESTSEENAGFLDDLIEESAPLVDSVCYRANL